ncbi:unnamed protein product [Cuscuta epithymum]|uniref:DUF4283 domain-containing protein n=1 Tax=Cuscuta epithymum TaxID=186058 RepID=A0AAV0CHR8_9ASTE|nr:unnamed protein product [Cuscuta epithymum]
MTNKWGVDVDVKPHKKGWVIFIFKNEEARMKVLAEGPYVLYGKTMFLKELSEDFSFDSEEFLKVPIWVKFPRLALRLWQATEIGMIASQVGVSITTDRVTREMQFTNYARVLIEVDVSKAPVLQIPIVPPSGKEYLQRVVFEWYPEYCYNCKTYGHHPFGCPILHPPKEKNKQENKAMGKEAEALDKVGGKSSATMNVEPPFIEVDRRKKKVAYTRKDPVAKDVASTSNAFVATSSPMDNATPVTKAPNLRGPEVANKGINISKELLTPSLSIKPSPSVKFSKAHHDLMVIAKDKDGKEVLERMPRGYVIRSMYEMDAKDIVTSVFLDERKRPLATIIDLDELPDGEHLVKVGPDLKPVTREDAPGVYFTHSSFLKLPGVKRNSTWYDFDPPIFYC